MKLKEILKFEKEHMNHIRYFVNYRVVPIYVLISAICLGLAITFLSINEERYMSVAVGFFVFFGLITVALLVSGPYIRKLEIQAELERHDFDTSNVTPRDVYMFTDKEALLQLDKNGIWINNVFYWYGHLEIYTNVAFRLNRVWISFLFAIDGKEYYTIPLNGDTLHMIEKFQIKLKNQETLDFIVNHTEEALTKIFKTGRL